MSAPSDNPRGCMVAVVGPSGAGKDTLLSYAAERLREHSGIVFVRRIITRERDAGGEDHDGVSEAEFDRLEQSGQFAVSWRAHGLRYGIPAATRRLVMEGGTAVVNGSRSALPLFRRTYPRLAVVTVTARREILAARLAARGRETHDDIFRRLERSSLAVLEGYEVTVIDNSGSVEEAGEILTDFLLKIATTA